MRRYLWTGLLLASAGCAATGDVGDESAKPPIEDVALAATRVAHVELTPTHSVDFMELPNGELALRETGSVDEVEDQVSTDALYARGISGMYTSLVGDEHAVVPEGLLRLEARQVKRDPRVDASAPQAEPAAPDAQAVEARPAGVRSAASDAAWFTRNFCSPAQMDAVWCPTNVTWAHTSWRPTLYYETVGMSASGSATATHWIDYWNGSAWARLGTTVLQPRHWQRWVYIGSTEYRSGIDGPSGIHLGERFRKAIPVFAESSIFPYDRSYDFANDIQGITHDANNWYLTRTKYGISSPNYGVIARVPIGTSLNDDIGYRYAAPSAWTNAGYKHFGDLVAANGLVYVAVDGPGRAAVGVFDTDLHYVGLADLPGLSSAGFLAYNPTDGLFYAATDATSIRKYRVTIGATVQAEYVDTLYFNGTVSGALQGAKFSAKGNLYISVGYDSSSPHGFYGIDGYDGLVSTFTSIPYGNADEFEGLDIFDADSDGRAPGLSGQIHVMQIENDVFSNDNFYLRHYRANDVSGI